MNGQNISETYNTVSMNELGSTVTGGSAQVGSTFKDTYLNITTGAVSE